MMLQAECRPRFIERRTSRLQDCPVRGKCPEFAHSIKPPRSATARFLQDLYLRWIMSTARGRTVRIPSSGFESCSLTALQKPTADLQGCRQPQSAGPDSARSLCCFPEKITSVCPVPNPSLFEQSAQSPERTADIRGRNCSFVYKHHAVVRFPFFRPGLEQGRSRSPVVTDKGTNILDSAARNALVSRHGTRSAVFTGSNRLLLQSRELHELSCRTPLAGRPRVSELRTEGRSPASQAARLGMQDSTSKAPVQRQSGDDF